MQEIRFLSKFPRGRLAGFEEKKAEFVITQKIKTVVKDVFYVEMFWIIQGKA